MTWTHPAPVLAVSTNTPGAGVQLRVDGDAGRVHTLQASSDFQAWFDLFSTNPPVTPFLWADPSPALPWRFYRVLLER